MTFKLQDAALLLLTSPGEGREEQAGAQLQLNAPGVQGLCWVGSPLSPQILWGSTGVLCSWPEEQPRSPSPSHHGPVPFV